MIEPVFEGIFPAILKELELATSSIQIVMAWFTDPILFDKIVNKAKSGVLVELVLLDHEFNKGEFINNPGRPQLTRFYNDFNLLENAKGVITLIDVALEFYMHSKFCIIDDKTVITGSYNWTAAARSHIENIVIIREENEVSNQYIREFRRIREEKYDLLRIRNLPACNTCGSIAVNVRIYDYFQNSNQYDNPFQDVRICLQNPVSHLEVINSFNNLYNDFAGMLEEFVLRIRDEEGGDDTIEISKKQFNSRLGQEIATYVGSPYDNFIQNAQAHILIVAKRTGDKDSYGEYPALEIEWNHDMVKIFADLIEHYAEQIMNRLY